MNYLGGSLCAVRFPVVRDPEAEGVALSLGCPGATMGFAVSRCHGLVQGSCADVSGRWNGERERAIGAVCELLPNGAIVLEQFSFSQALQQARCAGARCLVRSLCRVKSYCTQSHAVE